MVPSKSNNKRNSCCPGFFKSFRQVKLTNSIAGVNLLTDGLIKPSRYITKYALL